MGQFLQLQPRSPHGAGSPGVAVKAKREREPIFSTDYSRLGWVPHSLQRRTFGGCWWGIFTGRLPILVPNQQCIEGTVCLTLDNENTFKLVITCRSTPCLKEKRRQGNIVELKQT